MAFELDPPVPDGLVTPEVGPWSLQKHRFLAKYIDAFTTSMRDKWQLHYVDLFANAGIQRIRDTGRLIWGSPLIAAHAPFRFARLHLCEKNDDFCDALEARLRRRDVDQFQLVRGDANEKIAEIYNDIPGRNTLTLTFIDPYGFHAHYEMLRILSDLRTDLIIFFPDRIDANRNLLRYTESEKSALSRFLGTHEWVERVEAHAWGQRMNVLRAVFEEQLAKIGFTHVQFERVYGDGQRLLYQLVFASKKQFAKTLWCNAQKINWDGQRNLF